MPKKSNECCEHKGKKVFMGVVVFLIGLLWYLKDTGYISYAYLWPVVVMAIGVLLVLKGIIKALMK